MRQDGVLCVPFLGTCSLQLLAVKHTTRTLSGPPSTGLLRSSTQSRPHMHHDTKHEAPLGETPETTRCGGDLGPLRPGNPEWAVAGVRRVVQVVAEAGRALASF